MNNNAVFLAEVTQAYDKSRATVFEVFTVLSEKQLNWKPNLDSWSIGQCLEHIIATNTAYFPAFRKVSSPGFKMSFWEKWSPFSTVIGKALVQQMQETVKKKYKAPQLFQPDVLLVNAGVFERFDKHIDSLIEYAKQTASLDLDRTIISSPVSGVFTLNLRNTFTMLSQHTNRHIHQARRVGEKGGFLSFE